MIYWCLCFENATAGVLLCRWQ